MVASSEYESIFKEGTIKKLNCHTISFAQTDNSIIRSKYKGNSIFEKLLTLYQDIPKPLIMNKYYQYADGSVRNYTYKSKENLRGYPFIKNLTFYQSKEFRRNKYCVYTSDYPELYQNCENQNRKALIKSLKAEYAQDGLKNKALWEEVDIHQLGRFREVYMDYGIDKTPNYPLYLWQNSVDTWQFKNKVKIALEKGTLPPEVFYDFEKLKVLDGAVYGTLDIISLIPGADIFTDPLCAAYASARNDATNLTIYSAGAILPLASGAYIRGGAKALNEEIMVVVAKKADNEEVELVYKNINDIAPNELYIATAIDNKQTQAFLDETKKQLDLHSINTQLDNLGKAGEKAKDLNEIEKRIAIFTSKTLDERLKEIDDAWKKYYPKHFAEREFFEDLMANYRYKTTEGWKRTREIAKNFKAVDFYKDFFELDNVISTKKAVSMKTTKVKDVKQWLVSEDIKKNIRFLKETFKPEGLQSNGKILKVTESAEIHIYMPRENITDDLLKTWQKELTKKSGETGIKFEIRALEDFIK